MAPQKRTDILKNAKKWMLNLFRTEKTIDPQEAARLATIFRYPDAKDLTPEQQIEDLKHEVKAALAQRDYLKSSCGTFAGIVAFLTFLGFGIAGFYPSVCGFLFVLFPFGVAIYWEHIKSGVEKAIPPYRVISKEEPEDEQKQ